LKNSSQYIYENILLIYPFIFINFIVADRILPGQSKKNKETRRDIPNYVLHVKFVFNELPIHATKKSIN
jgi:hypothetical protein